MKQQKRKGMNLQFLIAFCTTVISHNVIAVTNTYTTTPPAPVLISELENNSSSPIPASFPTITYPYLSSLNYPTGLWAPGEVTSATFRVYLSDDLSTNFPPNFDSPVEFAQLVSVTDGSSSVAGLPVEVAVFPSLFDPSFGAIPIATATAAGIESPTVLPSNSGALYFDLDVTVLLNSSNTGLLEFSLIAPNKFPDISSASDPFTHALITQAVNDANAGNLDPNAPFNVEDPYHVWEDYVYEYAELTVTYGDPVVPDIKPVNIPTLSEWAMILLIAGLAGFAATRLKQS